MVWVEIAYSSPSPECSLHERNRFSVSETSGIKETNCGGTFIFVGDVISMAHSIQLTSYQPRLGLKFVAYFPNLLERILMWTFHVSLALTLLNGLPVSDEQFLACPYVRHCLISSIGSACVFKQKLSINIINLIRCSLNTLLSFTAITFIKRITDI